MSALAAVIHSPLTVFAVWEIGHDPDTQGDQADIVNNKRLGATLAMALQSQLENNERRSKSCPSRAFPSASSMQ
jgi:hypothetical protein